MKILKKSYIFLLVLILLIGCEAPEREAEFVEVEKSDLTNVAPTPGGSITIPLINFETLNPLYPNNPSVYYFSKLIYDSLFVYNEEGQLESNLVEHYVLSPDKMTLTLTLKDNLTWHDGSKLTTEDVLKTFNLIKNSEIKGPYYSIFRHCVGYGNEFDPETFLKMEIFDDRNIDLHFDRPYADILNMLTFPILNRGVIDDFLNGGEFKTMGSGPYKVKEVQPGIHIELIRNDAYHGKLSYIETIYAKIFDNNTLAVLGFETGQTDLVVSETYDWAKYQDVPRIRISEFPSNEMDLLIINNSRDIFTGANGRKIKQSISSAINKKRIIDRLYLGKAIETSLPVNLNTTKYYGLKSDNYYNEERSRQLLNEIGYNNLNENGFFENENGETVNIKLKTNFSNNYKSITADFIIQDLRAVGINAYTDYRANAQEEMSSKEIEKSKTEFLADLRSGDFDIAIVSVNLTDVVDMGALLHSDAIGDGMNYAFYSNHNLDYYLQKLKINYDYDETKNTYIKAIEIYTEDMPIVPLYIKMEALLTDEKLQGEVNPIQSDIYRSIKNMFILKQFQ